MVITNQPTQLEAHNNGTDVKYPFMACLNLLNGAGLHLNNDN